MRNKLVTDDGKRIKLHINSIEYIRQRELWDTRFINCALVNIDTKTKLNNEEVYKVDMQLYAELSGLYIGEAYNKAVLAAIDLRDTRIELEFSNGARHHTSLLYSFTEYPESKTIMVAWNKNFIPLLSGHLRAGAFISPLVAAASFSSNKKYLLYLLMERYLHVLNTSKSFVVSKEDIRKELNLAPTEYLEFKSLNAKVIKPALKDISIKLGINIVGKVKGDRMIFSYRGVE